jgi:hypothetical protein
VEFQLVAVLALLPLLLGILQMALLVAGYHTISLAAAEAARAGSVDHARVATMRDAFADGLVPLLIDLTEIDARGGPLDRLVGAKGRAALEAVEYASIERVSPTAGDFADHGRSNGEGGRRGIPNDALEFRSSTAGATDGHSIQQANLLRIRIRYCHALVVPLVDRLLPAVLRLLDGDSRDAVCYAAGRVPLRIASSAPMQSEAWP